MKHLQDESYTSVTDSCDEGAGVTKTSKGNGRRKKKRKWFDLVTGIKKVVKIRIYKLGEGISESLLFAGIGVEGSVNPPPEG